jgi:quercetin dioxygenase-like cupin family protein
VIALVIDLVILGASTPPVGAVARAETEEERIAKALQIAMQKHGGDVNRCFERALADTLDVAGTVELAVDVGEEGKVTRAVPLEHTASSPVLLACLQTSATAWTLPGVAAGSTVILPLAFEGQMAQFSVKAADAPERGPGQAKGGKGKGKARPPGAAAFTVKVLVDEATMRARHGSLSLLTVSPANRIAMHKHPGAEILYVKKGRARILGPKGVAPETVAEGAAVFIPGGMPHVIENMARTGEVEMLQVFAPPGPERVYRDPTDEAGRAAFEVIRDAGKAAAPKGARMAVETTDKATVYPSGGGKIKVHLLFDPASTDSEDASLSLVEFDAGAEITRHAHADSAEILYILSGGGELMIGSDKLAFGPEQAIHLPDKQPHSARFKEKTVAVQVYAPAGPEQRYKTAASGKK